jgi:hypothetical protein
MFHMKKLLSFVVTALLLAPAFLKADVKDRLYDFTDAYYRQNGIDPLAIQGRREPGPSAATDMPNFPFQRNVRALLTIPAYDHSGNANYFTVLGGFSVSGFTGDAAGQRARQIADSFTEYFFPKQGTDPIGLGATRQSNLLDMRNGYFSNDKLGLWIHTWINFTPKALTTVDGKKMMDDMARHNGRDLDGTAIIASTSEIDDLLKKGFITKTVRPLNDPLRYAICPVIKDPTDGGIARDQFLAFVRKPDGSALEQEFVDNFESLRLTGRPAN